MFLEREKSRPLLSHLYMVGYQGLTYYSFLEFVVFALRNQNNYEFLKHLCLSETIARFQTMDY